MIGLGKSNGIINWSDGTPFDSSIYGDLLDFNDYPANDVAYRIRFYPDKFVIDSYHESWIMCQIEPF